MNHHTHKNACIPPPKESWLEIKKRKYITILIPSAVSCKPVNLVEIGYFAESAEMGYLNKIVLRIRKLDSRDFENFRLLYERH